MNNLSAYICIITHLLLLDFLEYFQPQSFTAWILNLVCSTGHLAYEAYQWDLCLEVFKSALMFT